MPLPCDAEDRTRVCTVVPCAVTNDRTLNGVVASLAVAVDGTIVACNAVASESTEDSSPPRPAWAGSAIATDKLKANEAANETLFMQKPTFFVTNALIAKFLAESLASRMTLGIEFSCSCA